MDMDKIFTLIGLNLTELHFYPFIVSLDIRNGSRNTPDDLSSRICIPNKTQDVSLNVFNMITRINDSKALIKQILCDSKCKCDSRKCNSNQKWVKVICPCKSKNIIKHDLCEKNYI